MGCFNAAHSHHTDDIYQHSNHWYPEYRRYKLLLLGAGESGKSTLLKKFRRAHGRQYDESEFLAVKPCLTRNLIEAMRTLAIYSDLFANQGHDTQVLQENREIRDRVARMNDKEKFTKEYYEDFKKLWADPHFKRTLEYEHQFQLIDTAEYLFDNMHRFHEEDYCPTFPDILHSYHRNTVNKIKFPKREPGLNEEIYEIFDVAGQRNERRKWIHFFEDTAAVIFVVALSGYNQLIWENNKDNRMEEAIYLFRGIVNLDIFKDTHMIVFLNKRDLFEKKVGKFPVKEYFKDFEGEEEAEEIIEYFKEKFKAQIRRYKEGPATMVVILNWCRIYAAHDDIISTILMFIITEYCDLPDRNSWNLMEFFDNKPPPPTRELFFHITCATDTIDACDLFESCRAVIIKDKIRQGFL